MENIVSIFSSWKEDFTVDGAFNEIENLIFKRKFVEDGEFFYLFFLFLIKSNDFTPEGNDKIFFFFTSTNLIKQ